MPTGTRTETNTRTCNMDATFDCMDMPQPRQWQCLVLATGQTSHVTRYLNSWHSCARSQELHLKVYACRVGERRQTERVHGQLLCHSPTRCDSTEGGVSMRVSWLSRLSHT